MTPYLVKFIKTLGYLNFLRKLNEEKETIPMFRLTPSGLGDDVQRDTVHDSDQPTGSDNVESEILQTEKVRH